MGRFENGMELKRSYGLLELVVLGNNKGGYRRCSSAQEDEAISSSTKSRKELTGSRSVE